MKKITIYSFILAVVAVVTFFSCDNPIALGSKLDVEGPVVFITAPAANKSVLPQFVLEGTAQDYTGIDRMIIKAKTTTGIFPRQWRYIGRAWEVSDDDGATWAPFTSVTFTADSLTYEAEWNGTDKTAAWRIPVDLYINAAKPEDGQYTFSVQAWDKAGYSDDNSFKSIALIVDTEPPVVEVTNPLIYKDYTVAPLKELHDAGGTDWQTPEYLGKFITQNFDLKWQIEDNNDLEKIEIRFYKHTETIDNNPLTPLPNTEIYRYTQTSPGYNGSIEVPDLTITKSGTVPGGSWEVTNKILDTDKVTIKVVSLCYDVAGNQNIPFQEKTLGYFVYWPKASTPWIKFQDGLGAASAYYGTALTSIKDNVFRVYPSKEIRATAYQAFSVEDVKYSVYQYVLPESATTINASTERTPIDLNKTVSNTIKPSRTFPWKFEVPLRSGYYAVEAETTSTSGKQSEKYVMMFRVEDISFPDFPEGPYPDASDPLFKAIPSTSTTAANSQITISGIVSDATQIRNLCLVWINPESRNFAAMSQLAYFRDGNYFGWAAAKALTAGAGPKKEGETAPMSGPLYPYDADHPNKLWKLTTALTTDDPVTQRRRYTYSQVINLQNDLNIAPGNQFLKSQVFLLMAENQDGKTTIITYAPQGDTSVPKIEITSVTTTKGGNHLYLPNNFEVLPQFANNETITIKGTWEDDSLKFVRKNIWFTSSFDVYVNNKKLTPVFDPANNATLSENGDWTITATVRDSATPDLAELGLDTLKDTLVISASVKDMGGNVAEAGSSWLIKSDNLRLMRISSDIDDGIYTVGKEITLFLEFSHPVMLTNKSTQPYPELILNATGNVTRRAKYRTSPAQTNYASRQYFTYTVGDGDNTVSRTEKYLTVTGLAYNGGAAYTTTTPFNTAAYAFTWHRGNKEPLKPDGKPADGYEEVRLTMAPNQTGALQNPDPGYYVRTLPTTTVPANTDYQFTLMAGKHIEIDTAPLKVSSITADTTGYLNSGDIYMTVTFDKQVTIKGSPRLVLDVANGGTATVQTNTGSTDIRVNEKKITFKYTIKPDDTTKGKPVIVLNYTGDASNYIADLAGNMLTAAAITSHPLTGTGGRTLTGLYIETLKPQAPTVRVLTAAAVNQGNIVQNNVNGVTHWGLSTETNKTLSTLYHTNLWLAIEGNTAGDPTPADPYKVNILEYTLDGDKADAARTWVRAGNITNTSFSLSRKGKNTILARQTDKAGNVSDPTPAVSFDWDPGSLISRISSATANGTYTNAEGRNKIDLTVYFRKSLRFSGTPQITLNALNGGTAKTVTMTPATGAINSLTFTYNVVQGDATPTNPAANLDITALSGITAWDGNATGNGVNVSSLLTTAYLPTGTPKLDSTKLFTVVTGTFSQNTASFIADNQGGTGWNNQANANYHGIRDDDGSYWTTLEIPFNRKISKNAGDITITQTAGTGTTAYRLPAVITEAQYNRFKNTVPGIDTYYTKGTNGFNTTTSVSDTTTKYVLAYKNNPNSGATAAGFPGDTLMTAGAEATFVTNFREAEAIKINVNMGVVTITGATSNTLRIRLSGSNAPQVPGATYQVTYPANLLIDDLGNYIAAGNFTVTLGGVAKPFVRLKKTQDVISEQTVPNGNTGTPRLTAAQPFRAYARMDGRTPGSTIIYTTAIRTTTETAVNWGTGMLANTQTPTSGGNGMNGPVDHVTPATSVRPGVPAATDTYNNAEITLGNGDYEGYEWWVRARGVVGTTNSVDSDEKAYRTVITYQCRGTNSGNMTATRAEGQQVPNQHIGATPNGANPAYADGDQYGAGDQIWIRGGDAVGSSSIPGFPFTWTDNWNDLAGKRAGIRLMTKTDGTDLRNSTWKFITWDINATAYVDFILGRDRTETFVLSNTNFTFAASTAAVAWQYGPKRYAYQRAGWTAYKDKYPITPGRHRWCDAGQEHVKGNVNFSGTFSGRPDFTANNPTTGWTVNGN